MALKPTIYKLRIDLSDLDRNHYDALALTLALHPSETVERMIVRTLAYCINADAGLAFTKGLSEADEPALWQRTLDDQIALWIDVGEPSVDRVRKASRLAGQVRVYSFNTKSDVWWAQESAALTRHPAEFFQVRWSDLQPLARLMKRTMDFAVTLSEGSAYFSLEDGEQEVHWKRLSP